jgi:hypothetical protein
MSANMICIEVKHHPKHREIPECIEASSALTGRTFLILYSPKLTYQQNYLLAAIGLRAMSFRFYAFAGYSSLRNGNTIFLLKERSSK